MTGYGSHVTGYRVGVLAGGPSSEREISLRSGRAVHNALMREGIDAFFVDVRDNIYDIIKSGGMDVAFLALHGRFGEDGTVQKILDGAGIRYTGSGEKASRIAIDKIASKELFIKEGIPTPEYCVVDRHCEARLQPYRVVDPEGSAEAISKKIDCFVAQCKKQNAPRNDDEWLPVIVKPQFEGSSIGLSVVKDKALLAGALDKAFEYGPRALVEDYISGRELTVGILNDEPLPVVEIVAKEHIYDYNAKYIDSRTQYIVPAGLSGRETLKAQSLARLSHKAIGCRSFSRTDMIIDASGGIFVLEVNTIPGMTERSLLPKAAGAAGISFGKLCVTLVEDALR